MKHIYGDYEVIEHTDTVKPERFVIFRREDGQPLKRAFWLGKRGGFLTMDAAITAARAASGKQIAFMDEVERAMDASKKLGVTIHPRLAR